MLNLSDFNPIWLYVALVAVLFGVLYAALVRYLNVHYDDQPYTAILVVGGVLITALLTIPIIGLVNVLYVLITFAMTGTPMVMEYAHRYLSERKANTEAVRKQLAKGVVAREQVQA